jgi:hypothetical protein
VSPQTGIDRTPRCARLPFWGPRDGKLQQPLTASALGTFDGITYRSYSGFFVGRTSTGNYRVPYKVAGPAPPALGNGTVLVEPPHFAVGTVVRDHWLGPTA